MKFVSFLLKIQTSLIFFSRFIALNVPRRSDLHQDLENLELEKEEATEGIGMVY